MSHGDELPKVIDKSQADIDAAIAAIKASDIPGGTQDFAISCIWLAVWLPKALLEHKITLFNLRKLIFGLGKRNKKNTQDNCAEKLNQSSLTQTNEDANTPNKIEPSETETSALSNQISKPGHGRLPHSVYTNTIEHQLLIANLKAGDLCPMQCGGKLYSLNPGVIVRVQGQSCGGSQVLD